MNLRITHVLGKVDYTGNGRKSYQAEIEIRLEEGNFTISGGIWNSRRTDYVSCGQNMKELLSFFPKDPIMQSAAVLWERYHLNQLRAGSARQEAFLRSCSIPYSILGNCNSYLKCCEILKDAGLYVDDEHIHNGKPYTYGTAWIKEPLSADVISKIESLFQDISKVKVDRAIQEETKRMKATA